MNTHLAYSQDSGEISFDLVYLSFYSVSSITASCRDTPIPGNVLMNLLVLYVIILSAALDLVPPSTPKGIIAFWNIAPSIVAKFSWPYILKGRIRYVRRLIGCCFLSVLGMIVSHCLHGCVPQLMPSGCRYFRRTRLTPIRH
jgi:hypothetical protein